ncbi:MAG TPA: cation diffusion facilitator family transporter [Thermoplasmata archaeon]|jgi:cobalt-zinc-cadmium efflux system protein|nr:cation diffusion facilitator family transporter [Thermoplasmata archaeon]
MTELSHGEGEAEQRILYGLRLAVFLSVAILAIESLGALFSRSLSLTVDAVHNIPDIMAFAVSWTALQGTRSGVSPKFTYGKHRIEIFAGILNGLLVLGTGAAFGYEALVALLRSASFAGTVDPVWLLVAAVPTLALRIVNLRALGRLPGRVRDLNLRSVVVHLASDVAITATLLAAGLTILVRPAFGWADTLGALVIAGILVYESVPLLRGGWEVLTERTPRGLSTEEITRVALSVPGVREVHDLHVWAVCDTLVCLTAHVGVRDMSMKEGMEVTRLLRSRMEEAFGIVHATFEIEAPVA